MAASTNLCTRANVQNWLGVASGVDDDLIDEFLARASEAIENRCGRKFAAAAYTEYFSGDELADGDILVANAPIIDSSNDAVRTQVQIDAEVAVYEDSNKVWGSGTAIATTSLSVESEVGLIHSDVGFYKGGVGDIKVTYRGGYATLPTDLVQACIRLIAFWYNKSKQRADGVLRESEAGMSVTHDPDEWPEAVLNLLDPYDRRRV